MKAVRALGLILELALLAAGIGSGSSASDGIRIIGMVVVASIAAIVVFAGVCLTLGVLAQRERPWHERASNG